jgi:hypothetical protein
MAGKANKILEFNQGRIEQRLPADPPLPIGGVKAATLVQVGARKDLLVDYPGAGGPLAARTIVALKSSDCGREVLLTFEDGDPRLPVVVGFLQPTATVEKEQEALILEQGDIDHLVADGQTVHISGHKEIVLQCGQASITLNKSGKVVIKGTKIVTHASGINKIKGAAVSIN